MGCAYCRMVCNQYTDAANCQIFLRGEYRDGNTLPDPWHVASYDRYSAYLVNRNSKGGLNYEGTSNDLSILRYLDLLHVYNYKIMFYFRIFVDQESKPWRGRISSTPKGVKNFSIEKMSI